MMSSLEIELLTQIVYQSGVLQQVEYVIDPQNLDGLQAIVFIFENDIYTARCLAEDNTIKLSPGRPKVADLYQIVSASKQKPWSMVINARLLWAWSLTNQEGYFDGLRLEFASNSTNKAVIIEVVSRALSLKIYQFIES
jgi:hypothetical protein